MLQLVLVVLVLLVLVALVALVAVNGASGVAVPWWRVLSLHRLNSCSNSAAAPLSRSCLLLLHGGMVPGMWCDVVQHGSS